MSVLFFTSVDHNYKKFLFPYIFFANKFNHDSKFEIVYKGNEEELTSLCCKAKILSEKLGCEILIRKPKYEFLDVHKIRFYEEPITKCDYTYCGDIDILILEPISQFHINQMKLYNTVFDNVIRYNNKSHLSGLHFVKTKEYYELTAEQRLIFRNGTDEEDLLEICKKSGLKFKPNAIDIDDFNVLRPDHGFHISQNRRPFLKCSGMQINLKIDHFKILNEVMREKAYVEISDSFFDQEFNDILNHAILYVKDQNEYKDVDSLIFPKANKKFVIYSCQIGKYDSPMVGNVYDTENFDYFYFTDNKNQDIDKIWNVVDVSKIEWIFPKQIRNDSTRKSRFIKTHPHLFFKNYERSIWIDAHLRFIDSPKDFMNFVDEKYFFSSIRHPYRSCIYQEARELLGLKIYLGQEKDDQETILRTIKSIRSKFYPPNNGLIESGVMIRNHNDSYCIFVMMQWWEMIEKYSKRDQLSFNYIQWMNGFQYYFIDYGTRLKYIKQLEHTYSPVV